jgi:tRNA U34 5-methylaminomethyl-2-thiouridine-forming methyltransferase MnmC
MSRSYKLMTTQDGSHTLFVEDLDEHFHSVYGAIQESTHIFIKNGLLASKVNPVRIFEVGFGTGLNAILSCYQALIAHRQTVYHSIELYPLNPQILEGLNHIQLVNIQNREMFQKILDSEWEQEIQINKYFSLKKIHGDMLTHVFSNCYDIVFFDAFSPEKNPEIWNIEVFRNIFDHLNTSGILITYCAKGSVKRTLLETGFCVEKLPGPPGKREIIKAFKL